MTVYMFICSCVCIIINLLQVYIGVVYIQGSHMFSKPSNVLEFDLSVRVPSNVLEFNSMFSNVLETNCL